MTGLLEGLAELLHVPASVTQARQATADANHAVFEIAV